MRVTVFVSSSQGVDERYRAAVAAVGARLAAGGHELVYGGTGMGLMGVLADSVRRGGSRVTGVVPRRFADRGLIDPDVDELVVTDGMAARKQVMLERGEAFVALPGGFGTLDELLDVVSLRQLGYHDKPIVLFDVEGFYQPLLAAFQRFFDEGFADPALATTYAAAQDLDTLFERLEAAAAGSDEDGAATSRWHGPR